jgi:hypothetical protein
MRLHYFHYGETPYAVGRDSILKIDLGDLRGLWYWPTILREAPGTVVSVVESLLNRYSVLVCHM